MDYIRVILFDWGGTLAHVRTQAQAFALGAAKAGQILCGSVGKAEVEQLGRAIISAEAEAAADPSHREADLTRILAEWAAQINPRFTRDQLDAARDALGEQWIGSLEVVPGALEAVRQLREQGLRMGLVSNCSVPPEYCRRELARQGLASLMDFALFSSEVGYRKPSQIIYQEALQRSFADGEEADPSRVLFVGDSPALDVIAPAAIGMKTALVASAPGLWPDEDHARAKPDLRIKNVTELPVLLNGR
ncbi:MAG TPA: HAD family hydrolase [Phycisphaerae bacterium]|nr:HAD family hydrolase [Phycisphaerae bacterium]HRR84938.1 HAD family hydrolase [Phycisphaerae bacterium]